MADIEVVQGADESPARQITTDGITPMTGFTATDTLSARVWAGGDQPVLFQPGVTWLDPDLAKFQIWILGADTADLEPGIYYIQATATRAGSGTIVILDESLEITPSPGSAAAIPTYCTAQQAMGFGGGWLKQLLSENGNEGFLTQLGRARTRLEEIIQAHWRPRRPGRRRDITIDSTFSLAPSEAPDPIIQGYLDANYLIVRPKVIEICSHLAIAYLCEQEFTGAADDPYLGRARYHHSRASRLIKSYRAEIDVNQDGYADQVIPCTHYSIR